MEMKSSELQNHQGRIEKAHDEEEEEEDRIARNLNLQNLSKLILPPLGASTNNQNHIQSKGRIITPMNSKYRSATH